MLSASMSNVNATAHLAPFGQGGGLAISLRFAGIGGSSRASAPSLTWLAALDAFPRCIARAPLRVSRRRPIRRDAHDFLPSGMRGSGLAIVRCCFGQFRCRHSIEQGEASVLASSVALDTVAP